MNYFVTIYLIMIELLTIAVLFTYFLFLYLISRITKGNEDNDTFFRKEKITLVYSCIWNDR